MIHRAPAESWAALASQLLLSGWSVEEAEAAVKRVTELLGAIPAWWTSHDRPGLAALAAQGQTKKLLPMFRLAGTIAAEFEPVTVYHHEETD